MMLGQQDKKKLLDQLNIEFKNYSLLKNLFFTLDPELIHHITLFMGAKFPELVASFFSPHIRHFLPVYTKEEQKAFFPSFEKPWNNPLGLAAGVDKNALCLRLWELLGFGAVEIGSVTLHHQRGNPTPRIRRMVEEESLLNWMGFPSQGIHFVINNIKKYQLAYPSSKLHVSLNLGKNKETPLNRAIDEYSELLKICGTVADSYVINISSPNTANLRQLQQQEYLAQLLSQLNETRTQYCKGKALLLKISPDESLEFYEQLPSLIETYHWQGVVLFNTTTNHLFGRGGISGKLLDKAIEEKKLNHLVEKWREHYTSKICFISRFFNHRNVKQQDMNIYPHQQYTKLVYDGPLIYKLFFK